DLRLISGMPSWLLILFERAARMARAGRRPISNLGECWPNLRVLIHGGVSFAPYRGNFEEWLGRPLADVEVEPRSARRPIWNLGECWPILSVLIHGGVSFAPYRATFEEWLGRPLEYVEVYPASEGLVALPTERSGGLPPTRERGS